MFRKRSPRRDFSGPTGRTENPMFRRQRRRWSGWLVILLLLILAASSYLALAPRFRITSVSVDGAEKLNADSIKRFVTSRLDQTFLGLAWKHVTYIAPRSSLTKELRSAIEKLVSLQDLTIERQGMNALIIRVQERSPNLVWKAGEQTFYTLDDHGVIVERIRGDVPEGFPAIVDANDLVPNIGSTVLQPRMISALKLLRERLPTVGIEVTSYATWQVQCPTDTKKPINSNLNESPDMNDNTNTKLRNINEQRNTNSRSDDTIDIDQTPCDLRALAVNEPTLVARTTEGWEIRFDASSDLEQQLQKLSLTLRDRLQQRTHLKYVDVRFGDRVFFQ